MEHFFKQFQYVVKMFRIKQSESILSKHLEQNTTSRCSEERFYAVVVLLASEDSKFVTNQMIMIDS